MSDDYTPDAWAIVEINSEEHGTIHKVLCSWYGGYMGSDWWKLSSGIEDVKMENGIYVMPQWSGSVYNCHPSNERMSGLMSGVYARFVKQLEEGGGGSIRTITMNELLELRK